MTGDAGGLHAGADHIARNASKTDREAENKDQSLHNAPLKLYCAPDPLLRGRQRAGRTAQLRLLGQVEKILDPIAPILIFKTAQFR